MRLGYDQLGSRPKTVTMPDTPDRKIPDDLLLALVFVLHHIHVQNERRHA
jgi:hypothetical protein